MWRKRKRPDDIAERVISDPERARERTMNRAVKLLAAKPRSIGELREMLLEKSWTNDEIVDIVITKLREYNYLDDEQYATSLALSKLRQRPQGKHRLRQSLSQKKIDKETIDNAVASAFEKLPESELIDREIEKRIRLKGAPQTREEIKKFYDHLIRRGFGYDLVSTKLREISKFTVEENEQDISEKAAH